jgi:hypothetical protein
MARKRVLPESVQELIRWRWAQRPTIKSLSDEYGVSKSCIADILNPKLRLRRKRKYQNQKKGEYEGPVESIMANGGAARKLTLSGGRRMAMKMES